MRETEGAAPASQAVGYDIAAVEAWINRHIPALRPPPLRQRLAHSFIDVMADHHAIDPDAVGLASLGKKDDCIGRQLKTWYRSGNASIAVAQFDDPQAHALQPYFLANLAPQGQARIVHGVYARYLAGKKNAVGVDPDRLKQSITQPLVLAEAAVERLERRA